LDFGEIYNIKIKIVIQVSFMCRSFMAGRGIEGIGRVNVRGEKEEKRGIGLIADVACWYVETGRKVG